MKEVSFGMFLRSLRKENGLSQAQLGRLAGVSDKAVSKWESDAARPQSGLLRRLADLLGVTVDELLSCRRRPPEKASQKDALQRKDRLWKAAHRALCGRYGEEMPHEVLNRWLSEYEELRTTDAILLFELLRCLRARAAETGAHVLVRGALGSSFVAFVLGATEVNPLRPHTLCPHCGRFEWADDVRCGWDIPEKRCACGALPVRDGHDIPFETLRMTAYRPWLELSVSHAGRKAVREAFRAFFADFPVVTLRREAYPTLEILVAVADACEPALADGQILPFEAYGDALRHCPAVMLLPDADLDALRRLEADTGISCADASFASPEVLEAVRAGRTQGVPELDSEQLRRALGSLPSLSFSDVVQALGLLRGTGALPEDLPLSEALAYRDDVFLRIQRRTEGCCSGFAYKVMHDAARGVYARGGMSALLKKQLSSLGLDERFAASLAEPRCLYPKAKGVQYARIALLFLWYKLHFPACFQKVM